MTITLGKQTNNKGGSFVVNYVMLPGYPDYDDGLHGVGITWGNERQFIAVESEQAFWSRFPFNLFTPSNIACTGQVAGAGKADGESTLSATCQ